MYDKVIKMSATHIVLPLLLRTQLCGFVCRYILIYDAFRPREKLLPATSEQRQKLHWDLGRRDKSLGWAVPPRNVSEGWQPSVLWSSCWWWGWTTDQSMGWRRRQTLLHSEGNGWSLQYKVNTAMCLGVGWGERVREREQHRDAERGSCVWEHMH